MYGRLRDFLKKYIKGLAKVREAQNGLTRKLVYFCGFTAVHAEIKRHIVKQRNSFSAILTDSHTFVNILS